MNRFKNLLVAVDPRTDNHSVLSRAMTLAKHNGAKLKLVDVSPDFSFPIKLALEGHEEILEILIREKREKLDAMAQSLTAEGVHVEVKVLTGKASIAIIQEVLAHRHDLVIRTAKGSDSRRPGFFGNTAFKLLRKCPCAVWLVAPKANAPCRHIAGCVDISSNEPSDRELNQVIYKLIESLGRHESAEVSLIHAWSIWNEKMLRNRVGSKAMIEIRDKSKLKVEQLFADFIEEQNGTLGRGNMRLLAGEPQVVIPDFAAQKKVDLMVMGTVARSGLQGMIMGNTAELVLNRLQCSILALKPSHFVSPIENH